MTAMSGKKILIILSLILVFCMALTSFGIAYAGGARGIGLLGVCFLFTFGIVVVLSQLIPAGILLSSLAGAAFSSSRNVRIPIQAP